MEQTVRVLSLNGDGTAKVARIRQSACSGDCHKCSGCGAVQQTVTFDAVNTVGAGPGDLVMVRTESGPVLAAAAVLYMLPLLLFFAGYLVGEQFGQPGLMGCLAFLAGMGFAVIYDRKVVRKRETVYTITGFSGEQTPESQIKGDNDLD